MSEHLDRITTALEAQSRADQEVVDAILDALRAGEDQKDVAARWGKTREMVRQLARKHGVKPKPQYIRGPR